MARGITFTFEDGCNKYLENCRQRNLREGTINHYRQSYRPRIILELPSQNKKTDTSFWSKIHRDVSVLGKRLFKNRKIRLNRHRSIRTMYCDVRPAFISPIRQLCCKSIPLFYCSLKSYFGDVIEKFCMLNIF